MFGRIRVGIMGTGAIARKMAATIKHTRGLSLYAVGSREQETAESFASEFKCKKAYGSYEALVQDSKVDLVYVATPNSAHYDCAKLALNNGKPVLVEKPFMLNEKQAQEILDLGKEKGLFVQEAMWTRFLPLAAEMQEVIASGLIGDVRSLTAHICAPIADKQRIADPALGGGALLDMGVYVLTFASLFFGDEVSDIASLASKNSLGADEQTGILLRYADGKVASLTCTALTPGKHEGVIYGSGGYLVTDGITSFKSFSVYDNHGKRIFRKRAKKHKDGYSYELLASASALREQKAECEQMSHESTLKIMNMMDFIRKQIRVSYPGEE